MSYQQMTTGMPDGFAGRTWLYAVGWLLSALVVVVAYAIIVRPDLRMWDGIDTHGKTTGRLIALTFDDGPHPLWAPLLADTLEQHGARGTFMMVGIEAQRYPEITARLLREGHEVENHSMTHPFPNLTILPKAKIAIEVTQAAKLLAQFTGRPVRYFRPPGGGVNDDVLSVLKTNHLRLAWWSVNVGDWSSPTPAKTARLLHAALRPGLVVLMHERENSVAALRSFLADTGQDGYTYTTFTRTLHG